MLSDKYFHQLPSHHKAAVPNFVEHQDEIKLRILHNYEIIKLMVENTDQMFENKNHSPNGRSSRFVSEHDMDKVKTTLRQFVRDWSEEGREERSRCYTPIIDEILTRFPPDKCDPTHIHILVPGAGLGRLAFEIASAGYSCQGNEFSLFMLFASNFILNKCHVVNGLTLYPWIHQHSNNLTNDDQLRAINFPDINPADIPPQVNFSMAAGDFLEVYTETGRWDCVATVYFIDTAHNIISYIESIYKILKPGGVWVNIGPLLYHFAEMPDESSIELSYEDVKSVIQKFNFVIEKEELCVPSTYTQNSRSMLQYQYNCVFFVARKPTEDKDQTTAPTTTADPEVEHGDLVPMRSGSDSDR